MFLISFYIIENVENDNGKFKDEMVLELGKVCMAKTAHLHPC